MEEGITLDELAKIEPVATSSVVGLLHFQYEHSDYRQPDEVEPSEPLTTRDVARQKLFSLGLGTGIKPYTSGEWHFLSTEEEIARQADEQGFERLNLQAEAEIDTINSLYGR